MYGHFYLCIKNHGCILYINDSVCAVLYLFAHAYVCIDLFFFNVHCFFFFLLFLYTDRKTCMGGSTLFDVLYIIYYYY